MNIKEKIGENGKQRKREDRRNGEGGGGEIVEDLCVVSLF